MRRFFVDAKERAAELLSQPHVGNDVRELVKDLLGVGESLVGLVDQSVGMSADARVIKRRMEQSRQETKVVEEKFANTKTSVLQLATEIETVSREVKNIKARTVLANDPNAASVQKIEASLSQIVKVVTTLASL